MKTFNVYRHPQGRMQAVGLGWSWFAFLFGPMWAMAAGLWGIGMLTVVALAFFGAVCGGLFTGSDAGLQFVILVQVAVNVIFGGAGNKWIEKKLRKKGYSFVGTVDASNEEGAIAKCDSGCAGPTGETGSPKIHSQNTRGQETGSQPRDARWQPEKDPDAKIPFPGGALDQKVKDLTAAAFKAENENNWSAAVEYYEDVLDLCPEYSDVKRLLDRARKKAAQKDSAKDSGNEKKDLIKFKCSSCHFEGSIDRSKLPRKARQARIRCPNCREQTIVDMGENRGS